MRTDGRAAGSLWTIVLAAGGSTRLGRPKQLLRFRSGTLLHRTVSLAAGLTPDRIVVVLGAERLRLLRHLRHVGLPAIVTINTRWQQGMSGSLACGIAALPRNAGAALVLVTDQPLIRPRDLRRLIRHWCARPAQPAAASYAGRSGVPAIIPRRDFGRLRAGSGDRGARDLLRSRTKTRTLPLAAAMVDIDTAADAAALR